MLDFRVTPSWWVGVEGTYWVRLLFEFAGPMARGVLQKPPRELAPEAAQEFDPDYATFYLTSGR